MYPGIEYNEYAGHARRAVELERRLAVARQINETQDPPSLPSMGLLVRIRERVIAIGYGARRLVSAPA